MFSSRRHLNLKCWKALVELGSDEYHTSIPRHQLDHSPENIKPDERYFLREWGILEGVVTETREGLDLVLGAARKMH